MEKSVRAPPPLNCNRDGSKVEAPQAAQSHFVHFKRGIGKSRNCFSPCLHHFPLCLYLPSVCCLSLIGRKSLVTSLIDYLLSFCLLDSQLVIYIPNVPYTVRSKLLACFILNLCNSNYKHVSLPISGIT